MVGLDREDHHAEMLDSPRVLRPLAKRATDQTAQLVPAQARQSILNPKRHVHRMPRIMFRPLLVRDPLARLLRLPTRAALLATSAPEPDLQLLRHHPHPAISPAIRPCHSRDREW